MFDPVFIRMLTDAVGEDRVRTVLEGLALPPSVSVRMNPAKLPECPFEGAVHVPWSPYGYLLKDRPAFTLDPLFHAGCYYVQDSSAMFVGELFRRVLPRFTAPVSVLDLCAAPGGKTTDLAASLREACGDRFSLVANEVMHKRFPVLRSNVRTWGDPRVGVTCLDPGAFPKKPLFDIIVADVPCSGEGMFRKDGKAVEDWSEATVDFCAARSRRILADIWPALRPGGVLLYSTCTFNRLENDGTVAWIAGELGAQVLDSGDFPSVVKTGCGYLLLPGFVPGEGQYAAALVKDGTPAPRAARGDVLDLAERPVPPDPGYPRYDLDRDTALRYLHGDALCLPDAPKGLLTLCFEGHPLGPAKNLGPRCNNLYPKENRIRMNLR